MLTQLPPATAAEPSERARTRINRSLGVLGYLLGTLLCSPELRIKSRKVLNQTFRSYLLLNW